MGETYTYRGSAYFSSKIAAIDYYSQYGTDKEHVEELLNEGIIYIGVPPVKNEFDLSLDEDGRYWIREKVV